MKYFYDRKADSLYLTLAERQYGDSVEAAPGVVLDFDADGRLIGLDLERASTIIDVADLALHEQPTKADVDAAILDGNQLKKEREALGYSQVELGRKLSVSANTVARWERGELKIEHPLMLQLALAALPNVDNRVGTSPVSSGAMKGTLKQSIRGGNSGQVLSTKIGASSAAEPARAKKKRAG